jgi:aspartyl/asparaginyl beta-hydroxylase (cupin superfamily)
VFDREPNHRLAVRLGKRLRWLFNGFIAQSSHVPTTPYIDPDVLSWGTALEAGWADIRAELDVLRERQVEVPPLARISPDHADVAEDGKWKSFVFEAYGYHVPPNRTLCPRTSRLLDEVPGLVLAMFSMMEPGTLVPLHTGVSKALINVHLGIDVPPGDCGIEVDGIARGWTNGKLLVLDDTFPHQVWNRTDRMRVVLLMQIRRPVGPLARMIGSVFLAAVRRTSYIQKPRRELGAVANG